MLVTKLKFADVLLLVVGLITAGAAGIWTAHIAAAQSLAPLQIDRGPDGGAAPLGADDKSQGQKDQKDGNNKNDGDKNNKDDKNQGQKGPNNNNHKDDGNKNNKDDKKSKDKNDGDKNNKGEKK
ncbi:hypothetical protein AYO44_00020 [Planctomycetaceae bacterium SCGC AG-212-F19]|nr:hypothetical protein AYO44_00020 [Planctomycetaceae bacterium SCGC AG-212-F19]